MHFLAVCRFGLYCVSAPGTDACSLATAARASRRSSRGLSGEAAYAAKSGHTSCNLPRRAVTIAPNVSNRHSRNARRTSSTLRSRDGRRTPGGRTAAARRSATRSSPSTTARPSSTRRVGADPAAQPLATRLPDHPEAVSPQPWVENGSTALPRPNGSRSTPTVCISWASPEHPRARRTTLVGAVPATTQVRPPTHRRGSARGTSATPTTHRARGREGRTER